MLPDLPHFALALAQAILLLLAAPLATGFSRVMRAKMHNRQGPGVLQDYRDLVKLMQRQEVWPPDAGWVFRVMPGLVMATALVLAMGIPMFTRFSPISAGWDLITTLYLFALARFFLGLSGIDSGSSFAGVGASRELTVGVLVEPTMLLALFVVALTAGSTNLGAISAAVSGGRLDAAMIVAGVAFAFAVYVELGKLPYDVAEAEQELQEGPLTEYSGPSLAILSWAMGLKQLVLVGWFIGLFLPFGSAASLAPGALLLGLVILAVKIAIVFALVGVVSNSVARTRFRLMPRHSWVGLGAASLAFVFYLVGL